MLNPADRDILNGGAQMGVRAVVAATSVRRCIVDYTTLGGEGVPVTRVGRTTP